MKMSKRINYEERARIIKALAHPSRLLIIDELAKNEHCVAELTEKIKADISTVSKHLTVLKDCGIIEADKRGLWVYYRLRVPCITNFFGCVEEVLKQSPKQVTQK